MKKRLTLAAALAATIVMTGCMTEREYQLRKNDIEAKKEWKPTYQILSIKGPLNVPEGGELIINAPSQPFVHTNIPDGQAYQLRALTTTEAIGATATTTPPPLRIHSFPPCASRNLVSSIAAPGGSAP